MILKKKSLNAIGVVIMLLTTVVWGSAFTILKDTISENPKTFIIAVRFFGAGVIMCLIFLKSLIKADRRSVLCGMLLGITVAGGYYFQTLGLEHTTPGRNAFITAIYCVICPFLLWLIKKVRPKGYSVVSAVICIAGIGLISFSGEGLSIDKELLLGDFLTLIATVFFALQIIFIDDFQKTADGRVVLPVEILSAGVILFIISAITELPFNDTADFVIKGDNIFNVCYLTLVCTLLAQFGQFYGQKLSSSPSQSALILSLEAVFGAAFSLVLGYERATPMLIAGFCVVFFATLISVLEIDVLKPFRRKDCQK